MTDSLPTLVVIAIVIVALPGSAAAWRSRRPAAAMFCLRVDPLLRELVPVGLERQRRLRPAAAR